MSESFSENKKVTPIEHAFSIRNKERSKEEHFIAQELERLVPLLFAAEDELIIVRRYTLDKKLSQGVADNAPHIAEQSSNKVDMSEQIERLIDEIASIKAEMQELLAKMHVLDEKKKKLIDRATQFKDHRLNDI